MMDDLKELIAPSNTVESDEELIRLAAKYHGIDVPVQAIRKNGAMVVITIQGGQELSCKLCDLTPHSPSLKGKGKKSKEN
jgi:hypothetical protein